MAITEQLLLDLTRAQQQIRDLDNEIDSLLQPVTVPVDIDAGGAVTELRRDLSNVDATIDVDVDGLAEVGRASREAGILADEFEEARREADRVADEARRIKNEVNDAGDGVGSFATKARGLVGALAAFEGLRQTLRFIGEGVQDSAALTESLNRVDVLFGNLADSVVTFSQESTAALVLTQREALDAVATFGGLANTVGLTQREAVEFGTTLTDLSADLASFGDTSVDEAIQAVGSALRGESEPIRRFNVLLNESQVNAKAAELGLVGLNGEIDEAAKVQARYALILEQTVPAQGDLAATADSLGNKLKQARVDFLEFRQELGTTVTPAIEGFLNRAPGLLEDFGGTAVNVTSIVVDLTTALLGAEDALTSFEDAPSIGGPFDEGFLESPRKGFEVLGDSIEYVTGVLAEYISLWTGSDAQSIEDGSFVENEARRFEDLADAAREGIGPIETATVGALALAGAFDELSRAGTKDVKDNIKDLRVQIVGLGNDLKTNLAPELVEFSDELRSVLGSSVNPFATLEANFSAGADTFKALVDDETGEIVGSLEDFVDELSEQIAARTDFDANLAELGRRGFDELANLFREEGPATARLAAEALNDPQAAAEAEAQLEGTARSQADAFLQAYGQAFAEGDITQDYIAQLTELADAAQSGTVQNALIAAAKDLAVLFAANFNPQILIDDFNISLPANVVAANVGGDLLGSGNPSTAQSSGAQFGTQVININNATTEDVETSAAQAAQTLGAISGLVN